MTQQTKHTASKVYTDAYRSSRIVPENGERYYAEVIADYKQDAIEYAGHVERCINSHDDLVDALESLVAFTPIPRDETEIPAAKQARAALAKAKGEA